MIKYYLNPTGIVNLYNLGCYTKIKRDKKGWYIVVNFFEYLRLLFFHKVIIPGVQRR